MPAEVRCSSCGMDIPMPPESADKDVLCPDCGAALRAHGAAACAETDEPIPYAEPADELPRERMEEFEPCPNCSGPVRVEARRCRHCGVYIEDDEDDWEYRGIRRDGIPHRGEMILGLGIGSLVCLPLTACCFVFALASLGLGMAVWIMGHSDLQAMKRGEMDPRGESSTRSGMICGIVALCLFGLGIVAYVCLIIVLVALPGGAF